MALKLNERYPGRFNNPDAAYPQGSFKNRTTPTAKDGSYLEKDWANDKEGFFQSLIASAGVVPDGLPDEVGASQYFFSLIQIIQDQVGPDYLNSARINVASASNVNLTTAAPDTRHINITGTTTINGFTVGEGEAYLVRFNGAITLVNSASLVTQTGANIAAVAGDTCWIRATAANVAEVLCGNFLQQAAVGTRGQSWQDVTGSRAAVTIYTNATGRPIEVAITAANTPARDVQVSSDGVTWVKVGLLGSDTDGEGCSFIVPGGHQYRVNGTTPIVSWSELR